MIIHVTQDDIIHGMKHDCRSCPVAKAMRRELKSLKIEVIVFYALVSLVDVKRNKLKFYHLTYPETQSHGGNGFVKIQLPKQVASWIMDFDKGEKVMSPFEFELEEAA